MRFPWLQKLKIGRIRLVISVLAILYASMAVALDVSGHRRGPVGEWDAIVVAGARVDVNGLPSLTLRRRVEGAVALWKQGTAPFLVMTGGVGKFGPSEARAAADLAMSLGVPEQALVLEERSTSTWENAVYAAQLPGLERVVVVTDYYHVLRCERVFGRSFQQVRAIGVRPPPTVRVRGALREILALALYAGRGQL